MENFNIRKLEHNDYFIGYLDILNQLSEINKKLINENEFNIFLDELPSNHHIFVIYDNHKNKIIGSGTILIENKIIHNFGKVGHIEDVIVDTHYRNFGLGKLIVNYLIDYAKLKKCYKVILTSSDSNLEFYKKIGFSKKDNSMSIYF
jgi:glucosamine-phosphate N-acetyltransferase